MVMSVGEALAGRLGRGAPRASPGAQGCGDVPLKVILETCLLDDAQKRRACEICRELGVAFVKTSTGFSSGGATVERRALMRETVGPDIGVKASGGIRDRATASPCSRPARRLGCSAGCSAGVAIVAGHSRGRHP
jgi:deoxyribose-phosphate aldolase